MATEGHGRVDSMAASTSEPSPLLLAPVPVENTCDRQLANMINSRLYRFGHWKLSLRQIMRSTTHNLEFTLSRLLPQLIGARDYTGAGQVLSVLYHRFSVTPAACIQASLEILRRQPELRNDLVTFYRTAMEDRRLDKLMMVSELWMFHITEGEFYEAYHLYQDEIQDLDVGDDHRLLANFGILCYWLLIIESSELREKLRKDEDNEDIPDDEDSDGSSEVSNGRAVQSVEALIEAKYAFKPSIGIHILYQNATSSLRRAIGYCPSSALFVEYYVQLLTLVGDIETACDYLEDFYHMNSQDPHAAKLLARFLEKYYPDSAEEQAHIYASWMRRDPTSMFPVEKMLDMYGAGLVNSDIVVDELANSLDSCGGDLYFTQNPSVCVTLWKQFANTIAAMDEEELMRTYEEDAVKTEEPSSTQAFLAGFASKHAWWKRVYFSRPSTIEDVSQLTANETELLDVWIYRAVVADRLFPDCFPSWEILRRAVTLPIDSVKSSHIRLIKSFFGMKAEGDTLPTPSRALSDLSTVSLGIKQQTSSLPIFVGDLPVQRVLQRNLLVKPTRESEVTSLIIKTSAEAGRIDQELVSELEQTVGYRAEILENELDSISPVDHVPTIAPIYHPVELPAYVAMIEEATYSNPEASTRHLYSWISEALRGSGAIQPTVLEVESARKVFCRRWERNCAIYGHNGLLVRYETFISQRLAAEVAQGKKEYPPDLARDILASMKREVPGSDTYFPDLSQADSVVQKMFRSMVRRRRAKSIELRHAMLYLVQRVVTITFEDFLETSWAVCKQNGLDILFPRECVEKLATRILARHYRFLIKALRGKDRLRLYDPRLYENTKDVTTMYRRLGKFVDGALYITPALKPIHIIAKLFLDIHGHLDWDDDDPLNYRIVVEDGDEDGEGSDGGDDSAEETLAKTALGRRSHRKTSDTDCADDGDDERDDTEEEGGSFSNDGSSSVYE